MAEPIVVSYSELAAFRQCPLKHELAYRQRWRKPETEGFALSRGKAWHDVMELHYATLAEVGQTRRGLREAVDRVHASLADPVDGTSSEQQQLIWWMYQGYVDRYEADRNWEILGIEQSFQIPMVEASETTPEIQFKGKIDLVVRDRTTGRVWVVDHKTGYELPGFKELDIDDQFGLYLHVSDRLGLAGHGAIHSAARTRQLAGDKNPSAKNKPSTLDQRFLRTILTRTPIERANLWLDARRTAIAAYTRVGPPYSAPDPDRCRRTCDFLEAHMLMRKGVQPGVALRSFGLEQDFTRH